MLFRNKYRDRAKRILEDLRAYADAAREDSELVRTLLREREKPRQEWADLVVTAGLYLVRTYAKNEMPHADYLALDAALSKAAPTSSKHRAATEELNTYVWTNLGRVEDGSPNLYGEWILERVKGEPLTEEERAVAREIGWDLGERVANHVSHAKLGG